MRIVKAGEPIAIRVVQRERVARSMWPFRCRDRPFDLEFEPITLFEVMDAAVKRQQEL